MKFLRTFFSTTEQEITAVRKHIPDAPVFGSCVSHGPVGAPPKRIDLYRSARPSETCEPHFAVYEPDDDGQLVTDYVDAPAVTAVPTHKRKRKADGDTAAWIAAAMGAPE